MNRIVLTVGCVLIALSFTSSSFAALLAEDNFESYALGNIIGQGTAGLGWVGPYQTNTQNSIHNIVTDAINGFGQSLEVGGTGTLNNVVQREFDPQSGTVYIGFAVQTSGFDATNDFFQMYFNATSNTSGTGGSQATSLSGGIDYSLIVGGLNGTFFARKAGADQVPSTVNAVDGTLHNLVLRISKSGGNGGNFDEIAIFIDQAAEGTPNVALAGGDPDNLASGSLTALSLFHMRLASLESGDRVYLDNLRIGTTYADVVPEPGSIYLMVVAMVALMVVTKTHAGSVADHFSLIHTRAGAN